MRSFFFLGVMIPALAFSSKGASVPVPVDPQGRWPALTDAAVMDDGTWVVSDTSGRAWWSTNLGARWDSVPASPSGERGEIFGESVLTPSEKSVWIRTAGWQTTVFPEACTKGSDRTTSSGGWSGAYDAESQKVTYCRSIDGLRTWSVWFSIPTASLPKDTIQRIGEEWNDKIWYVVADSGYMRGTGDGLSWTRIGLPAGMKSIDFVPVVENGSDLVIVGGDSRRAMRYVASSTDGGANWSVQSMAEPGRLVRKVTDRLFLTATYDSLQGRRFGAGGSQSGPWTMFDTAFRGNLAHGDDAYVVEEHAIWKVVLDGVWRHAKPAPESWRFVREQGVFAVELPRSLEGAPWSLRALDGRKLAGGRVAGGRVELALGRSTAILSVETQIVMVPSFVR